MALTPEQLAQLQSQFLAGNYNLNASGFAPMALVHSGEDAGTPSQLLGYAGNFSGLTPGSTYNLYGTNGSDAGQRTVENGGSVGDLLKSTISDNAEGAALLASLYGFGSLLNGGLLGFGGATGSASAAGTGAAGVGGGSGAFLGEGVASGIPAWDAAATNAGLSLSGAGAAGAASSEAVNPFASGFTDTGTAGGALDTGYAGSGALTGATGGVAPISDVPWSQLLQKGLSAVGSSLSKQGQTQSAAGNASLPAVIGAQPQMSTTPGYYSIASQPQSSHWQQSKPYMSGLMNLGRS